MLARLWQRQVRLLSDLDRLLIHANRCWHLKADALLASVKWKSAAAGFSLGEQPPGKRVSFSSAKS